MLHRHSRDKWRFKAHREAIGEIQLHIIDNVLNYISYSLQRNKIKIEYVHKPTTISKRDLRKKQNQKNIFFIQKNIFLVQKNIFWYKKTWNMASTENPIKWAQYCCVHLKKKIGKNKKLIQFFDQFLKQFFCSTTLHLFFGSFKWKTLS